jgi:hypothetical protein
MVDARMATVDGPSQPPLQSGNRAIFLAAILGGLCGAVFSLVLARALPVAVPVKPPVPAPPSEAREFAEEIFRKLKSGKNDDFKRLVRPAFGRLSDEEFETFCKDEVFGQRDAFAKSHGGSGELEFARETVLSPSLVRVSFLEKFARSCILWAVVLYNGPDGWQVSAFTFDTATTGFRATP